MTQEEFERVEKLFALLRKKQNVYEVLTKSRKTGENMYLTNQSWGISVEASDRTVQLEIQHVMGEIEEIEEQIEKL